MPKKTLVLDLDETLICSYTEYINPVHFGETYEPDYTCWCSFGSIMVKVNIFKRPYLDYFLRLVAQWYNIVAYTASKTEYANLVLDYLEDDTEIFSDRLYRTDCIPTAKGYTKDLKLIGNDLSQIFIIDNTPVCYARYKENAIPIKTWIHSDVLDTCLLDLLPLLDALRFTYDVRDILKNRTKV